MLPNIIPSSTSVRLRSVMWLKVCHEYFFCGVGEGDPHPLLTVNWNGCYIQKNNHEIQAKRFLGDKDCIWLVYLVRKYSQTAVISHSMSGKGVWGMIEVGKENQSTRQNPTPMMGSVKGGLGRKKWSSAVSHYVVTIETYVTYVTCNCPAKQLRTLLWRQWSVMLEVHPWRQLFVFWFEWAQGGRTSEIVSGFQVKICCCPERCDKCRHRCYRWFLYHHVFHFLSPAPVYRACCLEVKLVGGCELNINPLHPLPMSVVTRGWRRR